MSGRVAVERLTVHSDARGSVYEPLQAEQLPQQQNAHVVVTAPGHVRGNHYHACGTETLTVLGPALVCWLDDSVRHEQAIGSGEAYRFLIPPRVPHAMRAVGPEPMVIVAFNSQSFDRDQPDAVRHVLLD